MRRVVKVRVDGRGWFDGENGMDRVPGSPGGERQERESVRHY